MNSLILRAALRVLQPLLLLYSVFLLLVGHNQPGGGFAGGLLAAAALALYVVAYDADASRELAFLDPRTLVGAGLILTIVSALLPLMAGSALLTGLWVTLPQPLGAIKVGTPLLFDTGIYLVVVGVTLLMVITLAEDH